MAAVDRLDAALATWAGEPYADLPDHPEVQAERSSLEQLRAGAEEARCWPCSAVGDHAGVLATTESATARHPLREGLWATHALALTRAGRQADALEALRTVRTTLAEEELGIDPGPRLRALESAVLRQSPEIERILAAPTLPVPRCAHRAAADRRTAPVAVPIGRDAERAALTALLDAAAAGSFAAAQVVGEPGIGKTRLVEDLAEQAGRRGLTVAVGRCSQDDGAPPLWPWRSVLETFGGPTLQDEPVGGGADSGTDYLARWDAIARRVVDAATTTPVLVVLEDLHWADEATLRTLAHLLATTPADAGLCVVGTRRAQPEPSGALALVAESFARRHAARIDVTGLDREGTAALLERVASDVPVSVVDAWHARSGGNPFFLVELARLGQGDIDQVPPTVRDVVTRRLSDLPERARQSLFTAAVTGRWFRPEVVAAANGTDLEAAPTTTSPSRSPQGAVGPDPGPAAPGPAGPARPRPPHLRRPRDHPRRGQGRARRARSCTSPRPSSASCASWRPTPVGSSAGRRCSTGSGATATSATVASSTSTSAGCAPRSRSTRPTRATS